MTIAFGCHRNRWISKAGITRILFRGPKGRSSLEIICNYQSALEGARFEMLYTCSSDCGNNFVSVLYGPTEMRIRSHSSATSAFDIPQDVRYLAAKLTDGNRTVHVSILTAYDNGFGKGIDANGHMTIYGVLFDTDSADIKPVVPQGQASRSEKAIVPGRYQMASWIEKIIGSPVRA